MAASDVITQWTVDDWDQVEQAWQDWRSAIRRRFNVQSNYLLEQAWAAGLLDSEAYVAPIPGGDSGTEMLLIRQSSGRQGHINLVRFREAVGLAGRITGPHAVGGQSCYIWRAKTLEDLEKVWQTLGPFLGPLRFSQFRRALVMPQLRTLKSEKPRGPAENKLNGRASARRTEKTRRSRQRPTGKTA